MARTRLNTVDKPIKPGRIGVVLATLGREIAQDRIPVGTALPPEPDLEARFGVGRGVVREVVKTLAEAMILVFLVMFLFLQNWRATVIPTIVGITVARMPWPVDVRIFDQRADAVRHGARNRYSRR